MLFGIPLEIFTMLGSSLFAGIMKIWGQSQENKKMERQLTLQAMNKELDMQEAARKFKAKGFQWTRRIIAVSVVLAVLVLPKIAILFGWAEVPIVFGWVENESEGILWWKEQTDNYKWVSQNGLVLTPLDTHAVMAIIGLYFGGSIVGHNK